MSLDPADLIGGLTDNTDVPKADWLAYEKARNVARFADVTEVNNTDLSSRYVIVAGSYLYAKAAGDTTSADNGSTIIVSLDGARWYRTGVAAIAPKGNWNAGVTYAVGDVVTYNNGSYICSTPNTNNVPAVGSSYWQVMALPGSPGGPISIPYTFDTTTTDSDPGNGKLRLGSATQNASTVIRVDLLDNLGATRTGILDGLDASTSTVKGFIHVQHEYDETKWLDFTLTSRAAPSGYRNLTVTCVAYSAASPFTNGDPLLFEFIRNGDQGPPGTTPSVTVNSTTTGAEGTNAAVSNSGNSVNVLLDFTIPRGAMPAVGFAFDTTTTDSDPGNGKIRFNNATPASVTALYVDNLDTDGNTQTGWLDSFDDAASTNRGTLTITPSATPTGKLVFKVTGAVVDGSGYRKLTVSLLSGATLPSNGARLGLTFSPSGDQGGTGPSGTSSLTICRAVATTNFTVASAIVNGATMDGVTLVTGDRVLLTGQTAAAENGVYIVAASGAASRDASFATYDSHPGVFFSVMEGTAKHDTLWQCTSDKGGTIGSTSLVIAAFSSGGGGSADGFGRARCVSTSNVTVSSGIVNGASVGGVTLATGDSVLLTGQTAPAENGLYTAVASGAAARHTSFATFASLAGSFFAVSEGTSGDTLWQVTTDAGGTLGTTAIAISQFMAASEDWGLVTGAVTSTDDWGSV